MIGLSTLAPEILMRSHTDPMHWSEDDMKKFLSSVSVLHALFVATSNKD